MGHHHRIHQNRTRRLRIGPVQRSADRHSLCHRSREPRPSTPRASPTPMRATRGLTPIPLNAPIEGGAQSTGDRHALAIDTDNCILYELYAAYPQAASWTAGAGSDLQPALQRPASVRLDLHRCRGPAGLSRAAALRRDRRRRNSPRHPLHRSANAARLRLAGAPLCVQPDRHAVSADGRPLPSARRFRHLGLLGRQPGDSPRAEEIRHDPGRQWFGVVSLGRARLRAGTTTTFTTWA